MQLRINVTQYGTVALFITVAAAVVLFLAAGVPGRYGGCGPPAGPDRRDPTSAAPADESTEVAERDADGRRE